MGTGGHVPRLTERPGSCGGTGAPNRHRPEQWKRVVVADAVRWWPVRVGTPAVRAPTRNRRSCCTRNLSEPRPVTATPLRQLTLGCSLRDVPATLTYVLSSGSHDPVGLARPCGAGTTVTSHAAHVLPEITPVTVAQQGLEATRLAALAAQATSVTPSSVPRAPGEPQARAGVSVRSCRPEGVGTRETTVRAGPQCRASGPAWQPRPRRTGSLARSSRLDVPVLLTWGVHFCSLSQLCGLPGAGPTGSFPASSSWTPCLLSSRCPNGAGSARRTPRPGVPARRARWRV